MEKTIKIQIKNSEIMQSSAFGGIQGEAEVRNLQITFDEDWEGLSKEITFFDAEMKTPVKILLNETNKLADNTYSVSIPAEPLKTGGRFVYVIDGKKDDSVLKSITKTLKVHYSPDTSSASEPESLTPDVVSQLNIAVEKNAEDISQSNEEIAKLKEELEAEKEKIVALDEDLTLAEADLNKKIADNKAETDAIHENLLNQITGVNNVANTALIRTDVALEVLGTKANKEELELNAIILNEKILENKEDINFLNNQKADNGTTLSEYGIEDAVELIVTEQHTGNTIYTLFNNYTTPGVYVFVDQVASMKQTYILFVTKNSAVYGGAIRDLFEQQLLSWNGVVERRKFYFNEGELVIVEKWKSYTPYTKTESDAKHEDLQSQIYNALDTASAAYGLASDTANIEMDKKADKTVIEEYGASDGDLSLGYLYNKEARFPGIAPDKLNFIIKDGVYEEDYIAGVSFVTNNIPPEVSYTNTGIVHWVGCDCSYVDGYSLFIPSGNMNYDIVFYFNGYKFIGLVNGYKTAIGNKGTAEAVSE